MSPPELLPAVQRALGRAILGLPRWIQRLIAGRPIRLDGIELETEVQVMLRLQERFGGPEYDELEVAEARTTLAADAARAGGHPIPMPEVRDLDAGGVAARFYVPQGRRGAGTAPRLLPRRGSCPRGRRHPRRCLPLARARDAHPPR